MFTSINCTVFDIPLTWDRTSFEVSRRKCQLARKLIETSINAQLNKQLRETYFQKLDIEKDINESQERFLNQERKVRVLDNLTEVASQSLPDYFDQRMENARTAIKEHCKAIQQILREENEHWQEIHTAIDENLITSDDLHPPAVIEQESPLANIHTIDEVDEEEHTSRLLNNKTVTPLLTQMMRKSRLQSNRRSTIEPTNSSTAEPLIQSKAERFSVIVPLNSARRTLPVIDTTFVVKLEESKATEADKSYEVEATALESISTTEVEATPSYSQPKPPARLYFSPTLLQDDEEPELIQPVLSTIDQNRTNNERERISAKSIDVEKPKIMPRRLGQTFLLDHLKAEEINRSQDAENIRPNILDANPFLINTDPSLLMEKQLSDESHHPESSVLQKSMIYSKRRTCSVTTEIETEPIRRTRRAIRKKKEPEEIAPIKRQTRKRKQSISDDGNNNTVALRKKKAVEPPAPKTTARKTRAKKMKEIPLREPSPLPIIDRSKHYSTRFSTRSHRFNNCTLSTTAMTDDNDDYPDHSKHSATRHHTKSVGRPRKQIIDEGDKTFLTTRSKGNKNQAGKRAKSMMVTKNRRK